MHIARPAPAAGSNENDLSGPWRLVRRLDEIMAADTTPRHMLEDVLDALHDTGGIAASWICMRNESGMIQPLAWRGEGAPDAAFAAPGLDAPCAQAASLRQIVYVDDWRQNAAVAVRAEALQRGWRSAAAFPIPCRQATPGVLMAQSAEPQFFSKTWPPHVLDHVAAAIGAGLDSRHAQRAFSRAGALYKTLFEGVGLLLAARSETRLLAALCQKLVESGLFISAAVGRMDEQKIWRHHGTASCRDVSGFQTAVTGYQPGEDNPPLGLLAWTARKSLIGNHYTTDPRFARYRPFAERLGIGAIAAIVIRRNQQRWGVLTVTAAEEDFFGADITQMLERLAGMVGQRLHEFDLKAALAAERAAQIRVTRRDALTGLPNALAFAEQLPILLTRAGAGAAAGAGAGAAGTAIARLDIEGLDDIFQQWGRRAGEAVVREFVMRLRAILPAGAELAHYGGEKFAIAFAAEAGASSIASFAERVRESLEVPLLLPSGQSLHVEYLLGATLYPRDGRQAAALLEQAETALYAARTARAARGPNWRLFHDVVPGESRPEPVAARLSRDALRLHYQPVLELNSGRIISVEALARLDDDGRLSMPGQFLPGLLMDGRLNLFRHVLRTALAQLAAWDREGIRLNLSVNIDAPVLMLEETLGEIREALAAAAIAPYRLALEMLETHEFTDFSHARARAEAFRRAGIRLALDDVGAGYASMLKIRELPLDIVKLDRAFIAGLRQQPDDLLFVSAFQSLTATRDLSLVVEGVESEDVLDALRMMGVRQAQGFLIGRPMAPGALSSWLPAHQAARGDCRPHTLLGAYAVHLLWLRAFNSSHNRDGLVVAMDANAAFSLTAFFAAPQWSGGELAQSYQRLCARMGQARPERGMIQDAAVAFRAQLAAAVRAQG